MAGKVRSNTNEKKLLEKLKENNALRKKELCQVYLIFHRTVNIVDVILQRLEKYATNLEELVDQRTQELVIEKQKSDTLLYRMLPK